MSANPNPLKILNTQSKEQGSRDVVAGQASNEFIFAVVGHAGSGTSVVGDTLQTLLESTQLGGINFDVSILKARTVIEEWGISKGEVVPATSTQKKLKDVEW